MQENLLVALLLLTVGALLLIAYTNGLRRGRRLQSPELSSAQARVRELEGQLRDKDAIIHFQRQTTSDRRGV
jgi:uncharacterized membrane protein affecting hemolysin expression